MHPTKPGFFKVVGRADDQLMLSTGEKTNPGPLGKTSSPLAKNLLLRGIFTRREHYQGKYIGRQHHLLWSWPLL